MEQPKRFQAHVDEGGVVAEFDDREEAVGWARRNGYREGSYVEDTRDRLTFWFEDGAFNQERS